MSAIRLILAAVLLLLASACGSAPGTAGGGGTPAPNSRPSIGYSNAASSASSAGGQAAGARSAKSGALRYIAALNAHEAAAACEASTPQEQQWVTHVSGLPFPSCPAAMEWLLAGAPLQNRGHPLQSIKVFSWTKQFRRGQFIGVFPRVSVIWKGQHDATSTLHKPRKAALWMQRSGGVWRVAKDATFVTHSSDDQWWLGMPPALPSDVAGPTPVPGPRFTCRGPTQTEQSPVGNVTSDHHHVSAPWLDLRRATLYIDAGQPCLTLQLGAPIRRATKIMITDRGDSHDLELVLAAVKPAWSIYGVADPQLPGSSWAEAGTTVWLRLDTTTHWANLKALDICVSSLQWAEPYLAKPVNGADELPTPYGQDSPSCE